MYYTNIDFNYLQKNWTKFVHGCGQLVNELAFSCNDSSSNPAKVYHFSLKLL